MAPSILIFLIAIGTDYSYEMKNSEIWAPPFLKYNNSFIATVYSALLSDTPTHSATGSLDEKKNNDEDEDIDFDDLTRRFEALKKKK